MARGGKRLGGGYRRSGRPEAAGTTEPKADVASIHDSRSGERHSRDAQTGRGVARQGLITGLDPVAGVRCERDPMNHHHAGSGQPDDVEGVGCDSSSWGNPGSSGWQAAVRT